MTTNEILARWMGGGRFNGSRFDSDLNAIALVEARITEADLEMSYIAALRESIAGEVRTYSWGDLFHTITAPASVRAEAAVRVLREAGLIKKESL